MLKGNNAISAMYTQLLTKKQECPTHENFRYSETKKIAKNRDTSSPHTQAIFLKPEVCRKTEKTP